MIRILFLAFAALSFGQQINLRQIQTSGTPATCSVLFSAGSNANLLGEDGGKFCYNASGHRLLIGNSTDDGQHTLQVSGTSIFYDKTAVTGNTIVTLRLGAGQSTPIFNIPDATNTINIVAIDQFGDLSVPQFALAPDSSSVSKATGFHAAGFIVASDRIFSFSSTTSASGSIDTAISRVSADLVAIGSGLVGDFSGSIKLTRTQNAPGAFSLLPTCNAGTEGSIMAVNDSTTLVWGTTVTGGSTGHVLAYCDSAQWTVAAK